MMRTFASVRSRVTRPVGFAPARRCVKAKAVVQPESEGQPEKEPVTSMKSETEQPERIVDPTINPVTGNPQTGKLIDVYFEIGALTLVVLLSAWSFFNAQDVVRQVAGADNVRAPAERQEWLAMDSQKVYGPCGDQQDSAGALEDLFEGKPCIPAEYARLAPSGQSSKLM